jgi:hypothetical protein
VVHSTSVRLVGPLSVHCSHSLAIEYTRVSLFGVANCRVRRLRRELVQVLVVFYYNVRKRGICGKSGFPALNHFPGLPGMVPKKQPVW